MKIDRYEYHPFTCAPCTRAHGNTSPMDRETRRRLHAQRKAQRAHAVALRQAREAKRKAQQG